MKGSSIPRPRCERVSDVKLTNWLLSDFIIGYSQGWWISDCIMIVRPRRTICTRVWNFSIVSCRRVHNHFTERCSAPSVRAPSASLTHWWAGISQFPSWFAINCFFKIYSPLFQSAFNVIKMGGNQGCGRLLHVHIEFSSLFSSRNSRVYSVSVYDFFLLNLGVW